MTSEVAAGTIHITARRWFQKTYGNTYHSVRIYRDGELIATLPFQYGYGDRWLQTAFEWLSHNGMPELLERYDNGVLKHFGTQYLREVMGGTYAVEDVNRKRDL